MKANNGAPGADDKTLAAIGAQIQRLRKKRGLTQKQLGEKAGVHEMTVTKYEAGEGGAFSILTAMAMAQALDASLDQLVARRGAPDTIQLDRDAPQWFVRAEVLEALKEAKRTGKWASVKAHFGAGFGWGLVLRPSALEVTESQYQAKLVEADDYIGSVPEKLLRTWFEEEMADANRRGKSRRKE